MIETYFWFSRHCPTHSYASRYDILLIIFIVRSFIDKSVRIPASEKAYFRRVKKTANKQQQNIVNKRQQWSHFEQLDTEKCVCYLNTLCQKNIQQMRSVRGVHHMTRILSRAVTVMFAVLRRSIFLRHSIVQLVDDYFLCLYAHFLFSTRFFPLEVHTYSHITPLYETSIVREVKALVRVTHCWFALAPASIVWAVP